MKIKFILLIILFFAKVLYSQDYIEFQELDKKYDSNIGTSVDISCNFAIIGNPSNNQEHSSAIIYKRKPDNTWTELQELKISGANNFGRNVLITQNYAFVSDGSDTSSGNVYVFKRNQNNYNYTQKISAIEPQKGSNFGFSIDIDTINNILAIGAPDYNSRGKVFIYKIINNRWQEYASVSENTSNSKSNFGFSIKIIENKLFVAAPFENVDYFEGNGKIYYYEYEDELWKKKQTIISNNVNVSQHFGFSIDVTENILLASAPGNSTLADNAGCVFVFNKISDEWLQTQIIYNPNATSDDFFGLDISTSENHLIVGCPYNNVSETSSRSGSCLIYKRNNDVFTKLQKIYPEIYSERGLYFGNSVDICDSTIIVGMPGNEYQNIYFYNSPVPFITHHPKNIEQVNSSEVIGFKVEAERADNYQWQISNDNGLNFYNADNTSIYFNEKTDSLIIKTSNILNNFLVRCKISNQYGTSISDVGQISLVYDNTLGTVYPNPSNGNFKIKFFDETSENIDVTIFDNYKNIIYQNSVNKEILEFSRPELPRGIYLVSLKKGKQKEMHKMMIIN